MSNLPNNIQSQNLDLRLIQDEDSAFIFTLVNTPGWKKFIADMKIESIEKATLYIRRIEEAPNTYYWVVMLKDVKIGILTFLKRPSLAHFDLGFAFLPEFMGKGYANEACHAFLNHLNDIPSYEKIQAITSPDNKASIKLLEKLEFNLTSKLEEKGRISLVYHYNK